MIPALRFKKSLKQVEQKPRGKTAEYKQLVLFGRVGKISLVRRLLTLPSRRKVRILFFLLHFGIEVNYKSVHRFEAKQLKPWQ